MGSQNILTLKKWDGDSDLKLEVGSFMIHERVRDSIRIIKLHVNRKPDKHSGRLGMFAYLHTKDGYQNLGFPEITLITDAYSDSHKFLSRKAMSFSNVQVESLIRRDDEEEIIFITGSFSEMIISPFGVSFD